MSAEEPIKRAQAETSSYNSFPARYKRLRQRYPDLYQLEQDELDYINQQLEADAKRARTERYVILVAIITMMGFVLPLLIYSTLELAKNTYSYIGSIAFDKELKIIATTCVVAAVILSSLYLILLPILNHKKHYSESAFYVDKKQIVYTIACIINMYLVIGVVLYFLQLTYEVFKKGVLLYISLPLFAIELLVTFSICLRLTVIIRRYLLKYKSETNIRFDAVDSLCESLEDISSSRYVHMLNRSDMRDWVDKITVASNLIRAYPAYLTNEQPATLLLDTFEFSASELDRIAMSIATLPKSQINIIISDLIKYINSLLQNDIFNLPKSDKVYFNKVKPRKARVYHYIFLALYLTMPIVFVILITHVFGVKFDDYTQSLLKILYVLWAVVGVFSNPFILDSENKDLIKDMIKSLLGK